MCFITWLALSGRAFNIMLMELLSLIIGAWLKVLSYGNSLRQEREQRLEQEKLQEDAQDFTHQERVEQNQYQQQMHEFNLVNDPKLMFQGLTDVGMSDAAALQAIAGAPSTGFSPTASNNGSGIASAPMLSQSSDILSSMSDIFNDYFENELKRKQGGKVEAETVYTKQLYNESVANIEFRAKELDLRAEEVQIAKDVAASQIGLYDSERDLNMKKLEQVNAEILKIGAQIQNLNAETCKAYAEASLYRQKTLESAAQTEYIQTSTSEVAAQTELIETQTQGQQIANLDANIVLTMKEYRLQVSQALGIDVDAPLTTQVIEAMLAGRYDTLAKLLEAHQDVNDSSLLGIGSMYNRSKTQRKSGYGKTKNSIGLNEPHFVPSFQPVWNP